MECELAVPLEFFDFQTPLNMLNSSCYDYFHERVIWVCKEALQREVLRISTEDQNLPSNSALIMLSLLGFSDLHMDAVDESEVEAHDSKTDVSPRNVRCSYL